MIRRCLWWLFWFIAAPTELELMRQFRKRPVEILPALIEYINKLPKFDSVFGLYVSPWCTIIVEKDIHGPEVTLNGAEYWLDIQYEAYGLTREQMRPLYNAILNRVPGCSAS